MLRRPAVSRAGRAAARQKSPDVGLEPAAQASTGRETVAGEVPRTGNAEPQPAAERRRTAGGRQLRRLRRRFRRPQLQGLRHFTGRRTEIADLDERRLK